MDTSVDHTLFNMNSLRMYQNDEKDRQISFGSYGGRSTISIARLPFMTGVRPTTIFLDPEILYVLQKNLKALLDNPGPNLRMPLKLTRWNRTPEGKFEREVDSIIVFGTDERGLFYIHVKQVAGETPVEARCFLKGSSKIDAEEYADQAARSMLAAEALLSFFDTEFTMSRLLTRNNMPKPKPNGGPAQQQNRPRPQQGSESTVKTDTTSTPPSDLSEYY